MKRIACIYLVLILLCGCSSGDSQMDTALKMRKTLLESSGCAFTAVVCADFTGSTYTFSLDCNASAEGDLSFSVSDPDTIAGISGTVSGEGGTLCFDEEVLAFETIAQGRLTPVSAPWVLVKTLRSGYISACGEDGEYIRLRIDDSYAEDALQLDIWIDRQNCPVRADIYWQQQRLIAMDVRNFTYL